MRNAVLFDLDGTLLNTIGGITGASNAILARYGRPGCTVEQMRLFVGNGARYQLRCAWQGDVSEQTLDEALAAYRPYYAEHLDPAEPYPGIMELLRELKSRGWRTAVVTNKPALPTERLCARFFGDLVDAVVGETPEVPRKPAPDMAERAMELLGVKREDCVFVGDGETDVRTARSSGIPCISCTWGYRTARELLSAGADIFADSAEELLRLLTVGEAAGRYLTLLKRRRSVRKFTEQQVEKEKLEALLSAALLVPTSRDLRPVDYYAVTDRKVIDAIAACKAHGTGPLKTAPLAIVLSSDEGKADTWCEDSSLAAISLQLLAEELGLASCWIQLHLRKDENGTSAEKNLARVLDLPESRRCVCVLAVGYQAEEKEPYAAPELSDEHIHVVR